MKALDTVRNLAAIQELVKLGEVVFQVNGLFKRFGQQTPRRWGWGTPLKKRTTTRIKFESMLGFLSEMSIALASPTALPSAA